MIDMPLPYSKPTATARDRTGPRTYEGARGILRGAIRLTVALLVMANFVPAQTADANQSRWGRYVSVLSLEGAMRYAYTDMAQGSVARRQLEYRGTATMRLNLWETGASYVQARGQTGVFTSAFSATDLGLAPERSAFNIKSFFLGQRFGRHVEAEVGGIEYEYGMGTEATYAAASGWMSGYRARVRTSGRSWRPGKISFTAGYAGDFTKPNFFSRSSRMGDVNYFQLLAQKSLTENADLSTEFDFLDGIKMNRNAVLWKKIPAVVLDEAQVEGSIRASEYVELGWAATAKKHCFARMKGTMALRYSHIPRDFFVNHEGRVTMLNGGEIGLGKRGAVMASARPARNFELGFLVSRRLDADPLNKRWRAVGYASFDFRDLANQAFK